MEVGQSDDLGQRKWTRKGQMTRSGRRVDPVPRRTGYASCAGCPSGRGLRRNHAAYRSARAAAVAPCARTDSVGVREEDGERQRLGQERSPRTSTAAPNPATMVGGSCAEKACRDCYLGSQVSQVHAGGVGEEHEGEGDLGEQLHRFAGGFEVDQSRSLCSQHEAADGEDHRSREGSAGDPSGDRREDEQDSGDRRKRPGHDAASAGGGRWRGASAGHRRPRGRTRGAARNPSGTPRNDNMIRIMSRVLLASPHRISGPDRPGGRRRRILPNPRHRAMRLRRIVPFACLVIRLVGTLEMPENDRSARDRERCCGQDPPRKDRRRHS